MRKYKNTLSTLKKLKQGEVEEKPKIGEGGCQQTPQVGRGDRRKKNKTGSFSEKFATMLIIQT